MSTEAQITANRANSQHSTGPVTEEGKTISARNNFRHGFTGAFRVLSWEKQEEFDALLAGLHAEHDPSTTTEALLVAQMAQAWWLRTRALSLQNTCFTEDSVDEKQLALYLRYQTTHDRNFHKSLNELLRLRAEKRKSRLDEAALCQRAEDSRKAFESQQREQSRARQQAELFATRARQQAEEHARRQAAEKRKQELHKWKVLLAEAEVDNRVLLNLNLQTPEHSVSVGPQRIIAAQNAA